MNVLMANTPMQFLLLHKALPIRCLLPPAELVLAAARLLAVAGANLGAPAVCKNMAVYDGHGAATYLAGLHNRLEP